MGNTGSQTDISDLPDVAVSHNQHELDGAKHVQKALDESRETLRSEDDEQDDDDDDAFPYDGPDIEEPPAPARLSQVQSRKKASKKQQQRRENPKKRLSDLKRYVTRRGTLIQTHVSTLQQEIARLKEYATEYTEKLHVLLVSSRVPHHGHLRQACNAQTLIMTFDHDACDPEEFLEVVDRGLENMIGRAQAVSIMCAGHKGELRLVAGQVTTAEALNSNQALQDFWRKLCNKVNKVQILNVDMRGAEGDRLLATLSRVTGASFTAPIHLTYHNLKKHRVTEEAKEAVLMAFDPKPLIRWQMLVFSAKGSWVNPKVGGTSANQQLFKTTDLTMSPEARQNMTAMVVVERMNQAGRENRERRANAPPELPGLSTASSSPKKKKGHKKKQQGKFDTLKSEKGFGASRNASISQTGSSDGLYASELAREGDGKLRKQQSRSSLMDLARSVANLRSISIANILPKDGSEEEELSGGEDASAPPNSYFVDPASSSSRKI